MVLICTLYKQWKDKSGLTRHGKVYNINHENMGQTNIQNKLVCQPCNRNFKSFSGFKSHGRTHEQEAGADVKIRVQYLYLYAL